MAEAEAENLSLNACTAWYKILGQPEKQTCVYCGLRSETMFRVWSEKNNLKVHPSNPPIHESTNLQIFELFVKWRFREVPEIGYGQANLWNSKLTCLCSYCNPVHISPEYPYIHVWVSPCNNCLVWHCPGFRPFHAIPEKNMSTYEGLGLRKYSSLFTMICLLLDLHLGSITGINELWLTRGSFEDIFTH